MARLAGKQPGALVVVEVGMRSPWVSRFVTEPGHRQRAAEPRKVRTIHRNDRKNDRNDAELLARQARREHRPAGDREEAQGPIGALQGVRPQTSVRTAV
jgi:transposase